MKTCDYCGKENEEISTHCGGCGTVLQVPAPVFERPKFPRTLDAKNAIIIFFTVVAATMFAAIAVAIAPTVGWELSVPLSGIFGGIAMIYSARKRIPNYIRDASPTGAAWIRGPWKAVGNGLAIGLILGLCNEYLSLYAFQHWHVVDRSVDPLGRMPFTPGWQQIVWVVSVVALGPPVEEMLFRGVLYGGFRRSFGREWAAILVTGLFVILHFGNYTQLPLECLMVTIVGVATLWCRLRWAATGPAVALHAGYNSMVALAAVHWAWR